LKGDNIYILCVLSTSTDVQLNKVLQLEERMLVVYSCKVLWYYYCWHVAVLAWFYRTGHSCGRSFGYARNLPKIRTILPPQFQITSHVIVTTTMMSRTCVIWSLPRSDNDTYMPCSDDFYWGAGSNMDCQWYITM